jgi:hypothetical protein
MRFDHLKRREFTLVGLAARRMSSGQGSASFALRNADALPGGSPHKSAACGLVASLARGVWLRHDLETMNKRLKAVGAKSAQEVRALTEAQLRWRWKKLRLRRSPWRVRERASQVSSRASIAGKCGLPPLSGPGGMLHSQTCTIAYFDELLSD